MLKLFRLIALLEGISFILLLSVAMPLKYYFQLPEIVSYVGLAHGILFLLYIFSSLIASILVRLSIFKVLVVLIAAVIPFGTFLVVRRWFKQTSLEEIESQVELTSV